MYSRLTVLLVLTVVQVVLSQTDPRIVGGFPIDISQAKYQASLRYHSVETTRGYGSGHFCGGMLINNGTVNSRNLILSAAHCFKYGDNSEYTRQPSEVGVALGSEIRTVKSENSIYVRVKKIIIHENFNHETFQNDVALLILEQSIPENHPTIQPISILPELVPDNTQCQISGWGTLESNGKETPIKLQMANVTTNPRSMCARSISYGSNMKAGMFCAGPFEGGIDSCQGDSGGPLACNGVLRGIVSFGNLCAKPNFPGVYMDTGYYYNWITKNSSTQTTFSLFMIFSGILALMMF